MVERYSLVPWVHYAGALIGWSLAALAVISAALSVIMPMTAAEAAAWSFGERVFAPAVVAFVCGGLALCITKVAQRRRGVLEIEETIRYRSGTVRLELPRSAAVSVCVTRTTWPLKRPTSYVLVVRVGDRNFRLPFAEHWLSGHRAMGRARHLAQNLGVPVEDTFGELLRSSRFVLVRWLGEGREWKVGLFVTVVVLALGSAFALYR